MEGNSDPLDSLVKEIMGNIRFLDSLLTKTNIIIGAVGIVSVIGVMIAIIHFL
jgi:hypothetical protein